MEKQTYKISIIGRVITIIAAIFSIVKVRGVWLDLYQVPLIFGRNIKREYTLSEISEFLDMFNMYLKNAELDFYEMFFSGGTVVLVIINVLLIILALINNDNVVGMAGISLLTSAVITGVFLFAMYQINTEMKEVTYGGVEELLKPTSNPYWFIAFSVLACIGTAFKSKVKASGSAAAWVSSEHGANKICSECGAEIMGGALFCGACGAKAENKESALENARYCTNCGAKMSENTVFCTECGAKAE